MIRFLNQATLGLLLCVTLGLFFSLSARATDHFGTDCQDVILSGFSDDPVECAATTGDYHYSGQVCSTSPSGKCCQYNAYNVYCPSNNHFLYNEYELQSAGQSGKTCVNGTCQ